MGRPNASNDADIRTRLTINAGKIRKVRRIAKLTSRIPNGVREVAKLWNSTAPLKTKNMNTAVSPLVSFRTILVNQLYSSSKFKKLPYKILGTSVSSMLRIVWNMQTATAA
jgi:hypothetical protein